MIRDWKVKMENAIEPIRFFFVIATNALVLEFIYLFQPTAVHRIHA